MNRLYDLNNNENLTLSGGCAMNSVMNGKILKTQNIKIFI